MKVAVTTLVFCVAALLALGLVMLYSSSMVQQGARLLLLQLIWAGLGLGVCVTAASLDYRWLRKVVWPLVIIAVVGLLAVFVPGFGSAINGSRRWIGYHGFRFQPSELAKIALILALAWYGERYQRQMRTWVRGVLIPAVIIGLVLAPVFVEPDRGATILMAGVSGVLLLVAGVRWWHLLVPGLLGAAGLAVSILHDPMRSGRILGWLNLEKSKEGVSYQAYEAMLAFGAGGWTGLGLGNSTQKLGFIPEHHTDFIFPIIGEELGLVATLLVVAAFVVLILCGIYIALRAPDTFGLLLGCGITFLIGFQAFINIGVVTSALPNKGLPLPFISYGGSNLLIMLGCVGLLLSIARHAYTTDSAPAGAAAEEQRLTGRSRGNPFRDKSGKSKLPGQALAKG